jgi:hypothetical protein
MPLRRFNFTSKDTRSNENASTRIGFVFAADLGQNLCTLQAGTLRMAAAFLPA